MKRLPKLLSLFIPILAVPATLAPTAALAASGPDLGVTIVQSGSSLVGTPTRIEVRLTNTGNRNAPATWVSIELPKTTTSPTVAVMGTLSNVPSYCARQATRLYCTLPTSVPRNGGFAVVGFDLAMPVSAAPLAFRADTGATNEQNPANNTASLTASQTYYSPAVAPTGSAVTNSHCTGTNLNAYFECTLFPGAIASHPTTLVPNGSPTAGTIDFSANGTQAADNTGTWSVNGSQLTMQYLDGGQVVGNFVGQGSAANCWDGKMTFVNSNYVALYRVCM